MYIHTIYGRNGEGTVAVSVKGEGGRPACCCSFTLLKVRVDGGRVGEETRAVKLCRRRVLMMIWSPLFKCPRGCRFVAPLDLYGEDTAGRFTRIGILS